MSTSRFTLVRRTLAILFTLGVAASVAGAEAEGPFQKFVKVGDGVYAALPLPGADVAANSGFVIGADAVWVFDALRPNVAKAMLAEIAKLTKLPVRYVVNSHHHYELVMGNVAFPQAIIVAHENTRKNLIATPPAAQIARTRASNERLGLPDNSSTDTPPVVLPDLTFSDRLVFHDGDREIQLIHLGRYHTDADVVMFLPREKVLFSGDLLPGIGGPGGQREAHFREFVTSIDKALALDFETIVPGRGEQLATKKDLRNFQQYFKELLAQVQTFIDKGATIDEAEAGVKPPSYIDPKRLDTPSFKRLWVDGVRRAYAELKGTSSQN